MNDFTALEIKLPPFALIMGKIGNTFGLAALALAILGGF